MPNLMGKTARHRQYFGDGNVTSFYVALGCWDVWQHRLCVRVLLSADILDHEDPDQPKHKMPGGKGKTHEMPPETGDREFAEEVARKNTGVSLDLAELGIDPVYIKDGRDDLFPGDQTAVHRKFAYFFPERSLINYRPGGMWLRTDLMMEEEEGGGGGILYPAHLVPVETAAQLFRQSGSWFHREALAMFIREVVGPRGELCRYVRNDFLDWAHSEAPFQRPTGVEVLAQFLRMGGELDSSTVVAEFLTRQFRWDKDLVHSMPPEVAEWAARTRCAASA